MKKYISIMMLLVLTITMYGCGSNEGANISSSDSGTASMEESKEIEERPTISKDASEEGDRIWYITGRDETEVDAGEDDVFGKNSEVEAAFVFNGDNVTLFTNGSVEEPLSILEISQKTDDEVLDILEQNYNETLGKGQFYVEAFENGDLEERFNFMPCEKGHEESADYDFNINSLLESLQVKDVFFSGYTIGETKYLVAKTDEKKEFYLDNLGNDGIKELNDDNLEELFAEDEEKVARDTSNDKSVTIKDLINSDKKEVLVATYHTCAHKPNNVEYVHIVQNGKIKSYNLRASFDKYYCLGDFLNKSAEDVEKMFEKDGFTDREWNDEWEAVLDTDTSGNEIEKETVTLDGEYYDTEEFHNFKIDNRYVANFGGLMLISDQPVLFEFDKADGERITEE